ncbi:MAG TPA: hypothetical protein VLT84_05445 [Acidobacteriota bacterium]|nr:hypothetical protein [Acidobacteriota bacterium]
MMSERRGNLILGSNVVELLLPHRRPFLMVDFIRAFHPGPPPALEAGRHLTANDPIFGGHFPGLHIWPGALTIEGLGQTGVLLLAILEIRRAAEAQGSDPDTALDELRNLEAGFTLQPGYDPDRARHLTRAIRAASSRIAVGTSVQMKFQRPVFAGQRLDYRVTLSGLHGSGMRFDAEASVEGSVVASGIMMGAAVARPASAGDEGSG